MVTAPLLRTKDREISKTARGVPLRFLQLDRGDVTSSSIGDTSKGYVSRQGGEGGGCSWGKTIRSSRHDFERIVAVTAPHSIFLSKSERIAGQDLKILFVPRSSAADNKEASAKSIGWSAYGSINSKARSSGAELENERPRESSRAITCRIR